MVPLAVLVVSAALAALTVTCAGLGSFAGAVYRPVAEIVPAVAFPPTTPFTAQATVVLLELPTVAVNCCVCVIVTEAAPGAISTVTAGGGGGGGGDVGGSFIGEPPPHETTHKHSESPNRATKTRTYLMVLKYL